MREVVGSNFWMQKVGVKIDCKISLAKSFRWVMASNKKMTTSAVGKIYQLETKSNLVRQIKSQNLKKKLREQYA